jgi:tetratricopeptide (TPR) repeat protein
MIRLRHLQRSRRIVAAGVAVLSLVAALAHVPAARADTVWVGSGPNALERKNMKIDGLTAAGLLFRSASVDRVAEPKPLKDIYRIAVDDEPALNAAETAFVGEKWDDAVAAYNKTINTSRKDWVKQYATTRMIAAAEKSGKFPAAVSAFAALAQRDPSAADAAQPDVTKAAKSDLPGAINTIKAALAVPGLKAPQKQSLQTFLGQLYVANGQLKEAEAVSGKPAGPAASAVAAAPAAREVTAAPTAPAPATAPPSAPPPANKGQVDLKLQLAQAAIKQKKFQEAIDAIESVSSSIVEPADQAEALYSLAEAKTGLAGNDPAKLQDAALAYMRVVAHFKGKPGAPHVADALLRAGTVLERAKMLPDALAAYEAVQADYKDGPQAKEAATAAARVRKALDAGGKAG